MSNKPSLTILLSLLVASLLLNFYLGPKVFFEKKLVQLTVPSEIISLKIKDLKNDAFAAGFENPKARGNYEDLVLSIFLDGKKAYKITALYFISNPEPEDNALHIRQREFYLKREDQEWLLFDETNKIINKGSAIIDLP